MTVVAIIGSLTPEKRVHLAVDAVTQVPRASLLVVGDGPRRPDLERRAAGSGGRVRALGSLCDVRPILHAADVILSTSSTEGTPGSLIEAALCGIPAVATDVGAVSDLVGDGGIVVPRSASAEMFAAAIRDLTLRSEPLSADVRARAVARFSWDAVIPRWQNVLDRVAA